MSNSKTNTLEAVIDNLPSELKELDQWVVWKKDKAPRNARTGVFASVNKPSTWSTYEEARVAVEKGKASGVGFVFTKDDSYVGIDLDHVIDDDGQIAPYAQDIIDRFDSYTEISLSGHGIHIIIWGKKPKESCKTEGLEVYDQGRYFALTGNLYQDGGTIQDRQGELNTLFGETFGESNEPISDTIGAITEGAPIPDGQRTNKLISLAGSMRNRGMTESEIKSALTVVSQERCKPPFTDEEIQKIVTSIGKYEIGKNRPLTDTGNAELLAELYGHDLRYDHPRKRWLLWNGHYWKPDQDGLVYRLAIEAARIRFARAASVEDVDLKRKIANWATGSESRQKVEACLSLARNISPFADNGENWDKDTMLLGVENGVIDLHTGDLHPGRREDRITMSVGFDYDPDAKCPRWEQFLEEIFGDDKLIDWLWRVLGYTITGDTTEHIVMMGYGEGANGKSRFCNAIRTAVGDYSYISPFCNAIRTAVGDYSYISPFSTFTLPPSSNTNDLAALDTRRFVSSSEANPNSRLNVERIKAISGEDIMNARYLYKEFIPFVPHLKLWLFTNHKPEIDDDTIALWRRIRLIPFTQTFIKKNADNHLGVKLKAEAPGIFAWLVRGCLEWQRKGDLKDVPQCIREATTEYRKQTDPILSFIDECCVVDEDKTVRAGAFYSAFKEWSKGQKDVLSQTIFGRRMVAKFTRLEDSKGKYYRGVGLRGSDNIIHLDLSDYSE